MVFLLAGLWFLSGGCSVLFCALAAAVADLCPMPEVLLPQSMLGCTGTCGALELPSSLATPGALSALWSAREKLLISELGECKDSVPQGLPPLWDDSEVCVSEH